MRKQLHKWRPAVLVLGIFLMVSSMRMAKASPPIQFGGWVTYWDFKRGMESAHQGKTVYQDIFLFSTQLNADGTPFVVDPKTLDYRFAIDRLKRAGIKTWMTFVNDVKPIDAEQSILKDSKTVHSILKHQISNPPSRRGRAWFFYCADYIA